MSKRKQKRIYQVTGIPSKVIVFFLAILVIVLFIIPQPKVVIKVTDDGFEPQQVSLSLGTRVVFENVGRLNHWPASNFHPQHMIYPEFDPKTSLGPGESWGFTPEKGGTWKFHDHESPHHVGILTVEPAEDVKGIFVFVVRMKAFIMSLTDRPFQKTNDESTFTSDLTAFKSSTSEQQLINLSKIANEKNAKEAWQFVISSYSNESGNTGNVHDLAHFAGQLLFQHYGFKGLSFCTPQFAFGCYHGFLDVAFKDDISELLIAENECATLSKRGTGPYASCVHGIGHGVASYHKVLDLANALSSCERLPQEGRNYCTDGVFMEFGRNAPSSFYRKEAPLYPCSTFSEKYGQSCGRNQVQVMMQRFGFSFEKVSEVCLTSSQISTKEACFDSLGFTASYLGGGSAAKIISLCRKIPDEASYARCATAAAGELIFQNNPAWKENSPLICESLTGDFLFSCKARLETIIRDYGRL